MPLHLRRKYRTRQEIPTTALPDIIFLLLIFFMVSTVMRQEDAQVRARIPEAEALSRMDQKRLITHIYIGPSADSSGTTGQFAVQVDDLLITDLHQIQDIMRERLRRQPKLIVSLHVDGRAPMGIVSDVQQELRRAGTLNVSYVARAQAE